jgi:hypothetical protein
VNRPLSVECPIHVRRSSRAVAGAAAVAVLRPRLPRVARLMALALRLEQLVRTGAVKNYATLADVGGVSRARISQIMNLIHLAPAIQEALLFLAPIKRGRAPVLLADLQPIAALADWSEQRRAWRRLWPRR